ncbi:MAG: peptidoglycan-binding domain-containing protein [Candidatus Paceibacterota bacterium]|jgi:hypothetical protein
MENKIKKNKVWWVILSIVAILIIGLFAYLYKDSVKENLGFATVYDAVGDRAISNDWKISSNSYAWGENIGWVDFAPEQGSTTVADNALWGYAYGENIGWISLNCANGDGSCDTLDYKVSNNGEGKLSGYAWGENIGWVDFGTSTDIASRPWGVSITSGGDFTGYAYGENVGWMSFNSANGGSVVYKVSTNWRPQSTRPQCNNGIDDDTDSRIDYPEDVQCLSLLDTRERGSGSVTTYTDTSVISGGSLEDSNREVATSTLTATSTASTTTIQATTTTTIVIVPPTVQPPTITPSSEPYFEFTGKFTRDLYMDLFGGDVKELQKFLNKNGFIVSNSGFGSVGNETSYYGNKTADAVSKLQEANSSVILVPYGLTKGTGYFGKSTRAFVNSKLSN